VLPCFGFVPFHEVFYFYFIHGNISLYEQTFIPLLNTAEVMISRVERTKKIWGSDVCITQSDLIELIGLLVICALLPFEILLKQHNMYAVVPTIRE